MGGGSVTDCTLGKWEADWVEGNANYICEPPGRTSNRGAELVDIARECAKQMDKDLEGFKAIFKKFTKKMKQTMKE